MARQAARDMASASRSPRAPVAALAFPLLTTTPREWPERISSRENTTGAATTVDRVNTPAADADPSLTIKARSRPSGLIPQRTPLNRNPGTTTADRDRGRC